jgi:hypothetical protein
VLFSGFVREVGLIDATVRYHDEGDHVIRE